MRKITLLLFRWKFYWQTNLKYTSYLILYAWEVVLFSYFNLNNEQEELKKVTQIFPLANALDFSSTLKVLVNSSTSNNVVSGANI